MAVQRFDYGQIKKPKITDQGYLKADAFVTRTGVFTYVMNDGSIRRELKLPEEVFNKDSLDTLSSLAVTNEHPTEFLTSENTSQYQKGFTADVSEPMGELVKTGMTITDKSLVEDVCSKRKDQTSAGYTCDVEMTAGVHPTYGAYDAIQRTIRYNHVAIVDRGRAGPEVRVRMDSEAAVMRIEADLLSSETRQNSSEEIRNNQQGEKMAQIKIDAAEYEASETLAKAVSEKLDALTAKETEIQKLMGKIDALDSELKKKDSEIETIKSQTVDTEKLRADARARVELESFAKEVLGVEAKFDSATLDIDIQKSVIVKVDSEAKLDGKSSDYVASRFDLIREKWDSKNPAANKIEEILRSNTRGDSSNSVAGTYEQAREKAQVRDSNLWKTNLNKKADKAS